MSESIDLEMLRCPVTRSRLWREGDWLVAEQGGRRYPIRDGIAILLPEAAENLAAAAGNPTGAAESPTAANRPAAPGVEDSSGPPQQQRAS